MNRDFSEEEIRELFSSKDLIGRGAFGSVYPVGPYTVLKTYASDYDKDKDIITSLREKKAEQDKILSTFPEFETRERRIIKARKKLYRVPSAINFINGLAYFEGYQFGTLLWWYKRYENLSSCLRHLTLEEREVVANNIEHVLEEFHKEHIYPCDIKSSNIMVRRHDLDVKFIDIEDACIHYCDDVDTHWEERSTLKCDEVKRLLLKK